MKYIIAIDQSTSASKAFLVDARGEIVGRAALPHKQYYPAPGLVEHDAAEIWRNVETIIDRVSKGIDAVDIAAIAIANQRETAVLWDAASGEPVCPAIVWQDVRGEAACRELAEHAEYIHERSGLTLSPYFPAGKLRALFRERPELYARAQRGELRLGTVDSYLVFRMTCAKRHVSDTTNASRTQLMNLNELSWDEELLSLFGIPACTLPEQILPADGSFGSYRGIPIRAVLGDSHAALFGQGCHQRGMTKATYGTGSSVMMNVGEQSVISRQGLSASVAFSVGNKTYYALEGNITCSGDTLVWLCEGLGLFHSPDEIEALAGSVKSAEGVVLVPAFAGLGAPYFDSDARAMLCGLNRGSGKAQIARAALECIAHQDADVLELMQQESGQRALQLYADGGGSRNALLMQLQADLANCRISCACASELSALGAAYIAGLSAGVYASFETIPARERRGRSFVPTLPEQERNKMREDWRTALGRCLSRKLY